MTEIDIMSAQQTTIAVRGKFTGWLNERWKELIGIRWKKYLDGLQSKVLADTMTREADRDLIL